MQQLGRRRGRLKERAVIGRYGSVWLTGWYSHFYFLWPLHGKAAGSILLFGSDHDGDVIKIKEGRELSAKSKLNHGLCEIILCHYKLYATAGKALASSYDLARQTWLDLEELHRNLIVDGG